MVDKAVICKKCGAKGLVSRPAGVCGCCGGEEILDVYKRQDDNNIPEIVLIPVDPKWDWIDEPIYCKKTNSEMTQDKKTSLFILKNDQLEDSKIDLQLISSVAMMENYLMDVNYMFDYEKLSEYCMKYWMGK